MEELSHQYSVPPGWKKSSNPTLLGDGAGFYRFPAWAGMKPNDVNSGHVARNLLKCRHEGITLVIPAAPLLVDRDLRPP